MNKETQPRMTLRNIAIAFAMMGLLISCSYFYLDHWPATWSNNNPSLLKDNAFGFHFWKWDNGTYGSFPSGHTALVACAATLIWGICPPMALGRASYWFYANGGPSPLKLPLFRGHFGWALCRGDHIYLRHQD